MTAGYEMKVQEMAAKMDDMFTRQDYEDAQTHGLSMDDIRRLKSEIAEMESMERAKKQIKELEYTLWPHRMSKFERMIHRQAQGSSGNHGSPQVEPFSSEIMAAAAKLPDLDDAVTGQQVEMEKPIAEMTHDECLAHMWAQANAKDGHTRKLPEPETQLWPIMHDKVCEKTKARWKEA